MKEALTLEQVEKKLYGMFFNGESAPLVATTKSQQWAYPHYTKPEFAKGVTVWGEQQNTPQGAYSDRFRQWDNEAHKNAHDVSRAKYPLICTSRVELYLSTYHNRPVELIYAVATFNQSSGYPIWYYGYRFVEEK